MYLVKKIVFDTNKAIYKEKSFCHLSRLCELKTTVWYHNQR